MNRAISFYGKVLDCLVQKIDEGGFQMAMFSVEGGGNGAEGSLV
jgi:predicted enzyme related to lactoylglutathione lyase